MLAFTVFQCVMAFSQAAYSAARPVTAESGKQRTCVPQPSRPVRRRKASWTASLSRRHRSSASIRATIGARAAAKPRCRAGTIPLPGPRRARKRRSRAVQLRRMRGVASVDPSSTATTSKSRRVWRARDFKAASRVSAAFRTGRITETRGRLAARGGRRGGGMAGGGLAGSGLAGGGMASGGLASGGWSADGARLKVGRPAGPCGRVRRLRRANRKTPARRGGTGP